MKFLPHSFGGVAIAAALLASSAVSAQTLGGGGGPAGDAGQVAEILAWSRIGPAGAAVENVLVETASGEFSGFEMLPTA